MPVLVAVADYNIAYLYYLRGEYTRSIELYRAAREDCRTLGDAYREALCDLDQSEMYLELNLSEEGAHLARARAEGLPRTRHGVRSGQGPDQPGHFPDPPRRQLPSRWTLFHRARQLFDHENNRAWIATIDLYQALVYHQEATGSTTHWSCASGRWTSSRPRPCSPRACSASCCWRASTWIAAKSAEARQVCLTALDRLQQAETPALSYQAWYVLGVIEEALGDRRCRLSGLPEGAPSPGEPAQPSQSGGNEDRLPQGQAGGLRSTGAHVPGPGPSHASHRRRPSATSNRPSRAAWPT